MRRIFWRSRKIEMHFFVILLTNFSLLQFTGKPKSKSQDLSLNHMPTKCLSTMDVGNIGQEAWAEAGININIMARNSSKLGPMMSRKNHLLPKQWNTDIIFYIYNKKYRHSKSCFIQAFLRKQILRCSNRIFLFECLHHHISSKYRSIQHSPLLLHTNFHYLFN